MTNVAIYRVDSVIQHHAKEQSNDFAKLARRYKALTSQKRFNEAFPKYGPRLILLEKGSGGGSYAHFYSHWGSKRQRSWLISLGSNRNEAVLLHEMAHHVARLHEQYGNCADHGPGFASALLDVVRIAQGAEAERALKHAYKALRIKVYAPGKPNGVNARVRGEAPDGVREIIDGIVGSKQKVADERALAREALNRLDALPGEWHQRSIGEDCPACGGTYEVSLSGRTRTQWKYVVVCKSDECSLFEEVRRPRSVAGLRAAR